MILTSREWHKDVKVSSILFYSNRKTQKLDRIGALKEEPFSIFQHFCRKTSTKLKGDPLKSLKHFQKSLTKSKNARVDPLVFFSTFLRQNIKKIEGGPLLEKIQKSPTMPKKN